MKIADDILKELNNNIAVDLIAINQYFLHARMLKNWGYKDLNDTLYKRSIRVMILADDLIKRVFMLEGLPNLQKLGKLLIGQSVPEILSCDLKLEMEMRATLVKAILRCEELEDYVSRAILIKHLDENEEYIDWLETQQLLLDEIGLPNYLQNAV